MQKRRNALRGGSWRGFVLAVLACAGIWVFAQNTRNDQKTEIVYREETVAIPFPTVFEVNRRLPPRHRVLVQRGQAGEKWVRWRVVLKNGKEVQRTAIASEVLTPPQPQIYQIGVHGHIASRGAVGRNTNFYTVKTLTMHATAYTPHRSGGGTGSGRTATGLPAGYGLVAVDPRVIPFGTVLYVEGYGMAIAADRGRAIRGNKIDLCYATRQQAIQFGRRKVRVHVLRPMR
ncbi:MAG: 3D domain-containing protein [Fimbriimonadales bacterium]|nr:G5 domain-containing protein [Armatimonadota bacterium]MCX7687647.1 3D domain-containing protein [Fimbriimonadales bacterium]CUU08476.1 3D (Asp-Asp-Asp) domain-containing protein [Armatimonadetes bacterium GBS]CUU35125.1 3D (Asp-Asp-Asp) domain-containing protein [Armatimonadetes bacterium DC]CUU38263.1 3D (Asp-Asp-Asp) domain-containing protein [Armatimonadetes bacterium GXS]GBC90073.1 Cell wall-binding protein YocH [bacterium HR14]